MKVLLVAPPYLPFELYPLQENYGLPMGLAYIAAVLEQYHMDVEILDLNMPYYTNLSAVEDKIVSSQPDIVGITAMTMNYRIALQIGKRIKAINEDIVTVMGGIHASLAYSDILKEGSIDYVVIGEGECTFLELVQALRNGRDCDNIKGLAFVPKYGNVVVTPIRPHPRDLDALPLPARHLFDMQVYAKNKNVKMITTRGCPYRCIFCSTSKFHGTKLRVRSPQNIVEEMEHVIETYDVETISFADDIFTFSKAHTRALCQEIERRQLNVKWGCSTRVDTVDRELLKVMHQAGCKRIFYGIESVSQETLNAIGKGFTVETAKLAVDWTKEVGIEVTESFIIGLPHETCESAMGIADFTKQTQPSHIVFNVLIPFPGTYLADNLEQLGIRVLGNMCCSDFTVPMIETSDLSWSDILRLRLDVEKATCDDILQAIELPNVEIYDE